VPKRPPQHRSSRAAELRTAPRYHGDARLLDHPPVTPMNALLPTLLPVAAIGWSLLYLLFGGGLLGAIVIFIVAKIFRK
jgi:hypothetical protein